MLNYEYKCKNCGEHLTRYQNMTDEPLSICPSCGGKLVRLLSGGGGVIYKGTGFYVNDYKKKQPEKTSTKE
ncbi:MAG: zinc ribbon domain-containing protein [Candidatus Marinimicrobia bacterium]|nr:zinc ribbon domain-containing protein [Candidatus Neomarinimicrobiota bacterium]